MKGTIHNCPTHGQKESLVDLLVPVCSCFFLHIHQHSCPILFNHILKAFHYSELTLEMQTYANYPQPQKEPLQVLLNETDWATDPRVLLDFVQA